MQTRHLKLIVAAAVIMLASCGKKNKEGRMVPKEAGIVVHVNGQSLSKKISWNEIKENALLKEAFADSSVPASLKAVLDNPENSGIDISGDMIFFIVKDSLGGYITVEGTLKDENSFKKFITGINESKGSTSEKDGINYLSSAPSCTGWNKEKFVLLADLPAMRGMDELTKRMQRDSIYIPPVVSGRDVLAACRNIFSLGEKNSLATDSRFTQLMNDNGDLHLWMNAGEFYNSSMFGQIPFVNIDKLYKGNITAATMNFDNGKIQLAARNYYGDEMTKLYKKYSGGKVDEDMLKRMPGKDVLMMFALNFKPEGLKEFVKLLGVDGFLSLGLKDTGFTFDDFLKANKGDVMIGVSDLKMQGDTTQYLIQDETALPAAPKPEFNFIFSAAIGDKDAFNKLIAAGNKIGYRFMDAQKPPVAYSSNGKYFALSNTKENADKYLSTSNNFDFMGKITGDAFGGYINLQGVMKALGSQGIKDSLGKIAYDASLNLWDNATMKGGEMDGEAVKSSFEINLMDKNSNSLTQLNKYFAKLGEIYQQKRKQEKEQRMAYEDFEMAPVPQEAK
jgi:hypothetical protein